MYIIFDKNLMMEIFILTLEAQQVLLLHSVQSRIIYCNNLRNNSFASFEVDPEDGGNKVPHSVGILPHQYVGSIDLTFIISLWFFQ
jgi:hypothetical protein